MSKQVVPFLTNTIFINGCSRWLPYFHNRFKTRINVSYFLYSSIDSKTKVDLERTPIQLTKKRHVDRVWPRYAPLYGDYVYGFGSSSSAHNDTECGMWYLITILPSIKFQCQPSRRQANIVCINYVVKREFFFSCIKFWSGRVNKCTHNYVACYWHADDANWQTKSVKYGLLSDHPKMMSVGFHLYYLFSVIKLSVFIEKFCFVFS